MGYVPKNFFSKRSLKLRFFYQLEKLHFAHLVFAFLDPDDVVGTSETEENFNICHDFFTSNMLYHTFLDPREKPIQEKFKGLQTKWVIQAKPRKAQRLAALLENFNRYL